MFDVTAISFFGKLTCIPFAVKIPNAETIEELRQAGPGEGLTEYANLESLKAGLS